MFRIFKKKAPVQLEMFEITEDQKACNENVRVTLKSLAEIWAIIDGWKHPVDHTRQLDLFPR